MTGLFFERFELPFLVIWMMQMFCNFTSYYYITTLGISKILKLKFSVVMFVLMPIIFIACLIPRTINEVFTLGSVVGILGVVIFTIVTVPLSIIYLIRKKGLQKHA